jgi:acetylornithine deacetylase/succinyl-diaminopimelate desuccinylase-like protein
MALNRDVIFVATADEEAGGFFGVGWLVKNRPELFKGVGYVINEGAGGRLQGGRTQFGIEVTQKIPYWLHLTARGEPGHGSTPRASSAVTTLIAALERLRQHQFEPQHRPGRGRVLQGHRASCAASLARALREYLDRDPQTRRAGGAPAMIRDCIHWSGTPAQSPFGIAVDAKFIINVEPPPGR